MMVYTRRDFVKASSRAALLGLAGSYVLPADVFAYSVGELCGNLPNPDVQTLRTAALQAVDVARSAGADFADVRINHGVRMGIGIHNEKVNPPFLGFTYTIGIRAAVNSAWGCAGTSDVTPDGIATAARLAVALAKAGYTRRPRAFELAPAPVVADGEWTTPIETDPFTIPIAEQQALWREAGAYVRRSVPQLQKYRNSIWGTGSWIKSDRVFASTEGSLIHQQMYHAYPSATVFVGLLDDITRGFGDHVRAFGRGSYGYEAIARHNVGELWRAAAEQAVAEASSPPPLKEVDIGRYDIVMSATAVSRALLETVAEALDMERARGEAINRQGTTYAMPPMETLGKFKAASELVTIIADRSQPHSGSAVRWDDEGVSPESFTLIKQGMVVDYLTTRRTAPAAAAWYAAQGAPVRSRGCAVGGGAAAPQSQVPNLTMQPGESGVTEDDLIADVKRGFHVEYLDDGSIDHQVLNSQYRIAGREIINGKLGPYVKKMGVQFNSPNFWNAVTALGGPATTEAREEDVGPFASGYSPTATITVVPMLVRDVNIVNLGRHG